MDDTVSRAAAIDAVSRGCQEFRGIFAECEKNLNALPAVQTCDDAVSRQAAITILDAWLRVHGGAYGKGLSAARELIADLPAVQSQPEIIRCKDCRWGKEACGNIECFVDSNIPPEYHGYDWFCPNGERRTE